MTGPQMEISLDDVQRMALELWVARREIDRLTVENVELRSRQQALAPAEHDEAAAP